MMVRSPSIRIAGLMLSTALLAACQARDPMWVLDQNAIDPKGCAASGHANYYACRSAESAARDRLNTDRSRCYAESGSAPPTQADLQQDIALGTPGMARIMAQARA